MKVTTRHQLFKFRAQNNVLSHPFYTLTLSHSIINAFYGLESHFLFIDLFISTAFIYRLIYFFVTFCIIGYFVATVLKQASGTACFSAYSIKHNFETGGIYINRNFCHHFSLNFILQVEETTALLSVLS